MTVLDLMAVMIIRVNHRHSVLGPGESHPEGGTSLELIPVSRSLSGAQFHLPPQPKAATLLWIRDSPPHSVYLCPLCQREGEVQEASGFLAGPMGRGQCTLQDRECQAGRLNRTLGPDGLGAVG